ncbi:hypothetical protein ACIHFD_49530 [Nonomuraea sp. NPDC051941]|uniref:hypothetical protein n=1 Tax=Nonomuraea sp. NPDC051941 TaxID=3364373 RepID=UPI0037C80B6F
MYDKASKAWQVLGFEDFGAYVDFTVSLVHGKWKEFGFKDADEATAYLIALMQGAMVPPPYLRGREMLPLADTAAA